MALAPKNRKRDETNPASSAKNLVENVKDVASQIKEKRIVLTNK